MTLTKQQKIYGAMLVLAVGAFVWDRANSLPQKATAAVDLAIHNAQAGKLLAPSARSSPFNPAPSPAPSSGRGIEQRLAALAKAQCLDPSSADDAFALAPVWWAHNTTGPVDIGPADQELLAKFAKHHLGAVMVRGKGGYALVDKDVVFVGKEYDGFTLLSLTKTTAVFNLRDLRVELRLQGDANSKDSGDVIKNTTDKGQTK